jgi:hypothetical protein
MPGPYVEKKISTRRGNCSRAKSVTGRLASSIIGKEIHGKRSRSIIKSVMPKVIIIVAIEKKRQERPTIIFVGKDLRKSSSLYRDVRIPKNINNEDVDANNDIASDTMKTMNEFPCKYIGIPEN